MSSDQSIADQAQVATSARMVAALAIALVTAAWTIYQYPSLPAEIPIHFDARGNPDGWAPKQVGAFLGVICQTLMIILMRVTYWLLNRPEQKPTFKFLAALDKQSKEIKIALRPKTLILMDGVFFALLILFTSLQYATIMAARGKFTPMAWLVIFPVFIVGWSLVWSLGISLEARRLQRAEEERKLWGQSS